MFLQILFLARAKIESEEVSDDEKTDISATVGGHAGQPAGLRGLGKNAVGQDPPHRGPERPHHHGSGQSALHGEERHRRHGLRPAALWRGR